MSDATGSTRPGLVFERDGPIARVRLARPEARNAFNAELISGLHETFEALAEASAESLRGVVLSGDGPVFCAGADIAWQRAARDLTLEENEADAARLQEMLAAIDECPAPVVARVHGAALGGGMGLCAVADIVLAEANTTFGFTETRLGIMPAVISPFVLARIGEGQARALFPGGERFDANRALHIGLVHEVLPDIASLDARVEAVVEALLAAGPTAARGAKSMIRAQRDLAPDGARTLTVGIAARQRVSAEGQEGLAAFLEKRRPSWTDQE